MTRSVKYNDSQTVWQNEQYHGQILNLDVSKFNSLVVSDLNRSPAYMAAYFVISVNGTNYTSGNTINVSSMTSINIDLYYSRSEVAAGSLSITISCKISLS